MIQVCSTIGGRAISFDRKLLFSGYVPGGEVIFFPKVIFFAGHHCVQGIIPGCNIFLWVSVYSRYARLWGVG